MLAVSSVILRTARGTISALRSVTSVGVRIGISVIATWLAFAHMVLAVIETLNTGFAESMKAVAAINDKRTSSSRAGMASESEKSDEERRRRRGGDDAKGAA